MRDMGDMRWIHCTAGKDRTGVLASAVYYLVGVEREDIIADYGVTEKELQMLKQYFLV